VLAAEGLQSSAHHYDYGDVTVGTSVSASFTFTNVGPTTVAVGEFTFGYVDRGALDFSFGDFGCTGVTLAPGESCTTSFVFTPSATGRRTVTAGLRIQEEPVPGFGFGRGTARIQLVGTGI
jgi:hypothetical protein